MPLVEFFTPEKERVSPLVYLDGALQRREGYLHPLAVCGILKTIQSRGQSVTASMVVGCPVKGAQALLLDYADDPQSMIYYAFRGTVIHKVMETVATQQNDFPGSLGVEVEHRIKAAAAEFLIEKRFFRTVKHKKITMQVSGQIDWYWFRDGTLGDWKTMETFGLEYIKDKGAKEEHIGQTNWLKWLMEGPQYKIPVKRIEIGYLGMSGMVFTGRLNTIRLIDHGSLFPVEEVRLWGPGEVEERLLPTAFQIQRAFASKGAELPDPNGGERNWRCGFCPFRGDIPGNWTCAVGAAEMKRRRTIDLLATVRREMVARKVLVGGKRLVYAFSDIAKRHGVKKISELSLPQAEQEAATAESLLKAHKAEHGNGPVAEPDLAAGDEELDKAA